MNTPLSLSTDYDIFQTKHYENVKKLESHRIAVRYFAYTVDPRQNVTRCCGNFPTASIFTKSLFSPSLSQQIKPQYNGIFYYVISLQRHFFCRPNLVFSYIFQPQYNVNMKTSKYVSAKLRTSHWIRLLHITHLQSWSITKLANNGTSGSKYKLTADCQNCTATTNITQIRVAMNIELP